MKLPRSLTTVTFFSKTLAVFLFFAFLFSAFYIGMQYQKTLDTLSFYTALPTPTPSAEGMHCGGFITHPKECPPGYMCKLGRIPDIGGTCIRIGY